MRDLVWCRAWAGFFHDRGAAESPQISVVQPSTVAVTSVLVGACGYRNLKLRLAHRMSLTRAVHAVTVISL